MSVILRCVTGGEMNIIEEALSHYDMTTKETKEAHKLIEQRACDTTLPFKAYSAAHTAASQVINKRK